MITVRDLANDLAGQGVTRERFHEILSGFGIDSYAPGADAMDVEQQVASVPLLGHEGAAIGAPPPIEPTPPPEPAPRFDMPTALTPQTQAALLPAPQRPLPYATDVQRPDITAPRMTAAPTPTPPDYTAYEEGRRGWEQQLEGLGSPMLRGVREGAEDIVSHLTRPDEPPELTREREAQRGLDPYQKAGVVDWPFWKGRLHAATVRAGSLAGTAAGAATSLGLEAYARASPEEWASDEELDDWQPARVRSPQDRRMWDAQWERERGETRNVMNAIIEEAVKRNEEQGFLESVRDSAYELVEATAHILSWMSGGDIPKEFWRESERVEREELLANMAGVEVHEMAATLAQADQVQGVASPHTVLMEEAGKRWPELGREIISFLGATFNEPAEVAAAYPVPLIALIYPLARRLGIPLSERASAAGAAVSKKLQQSNVPYLGAFVDTMNEAWSGFQRWKVDPAHMADPAIRQLAENLIREAANTEFGVGALGPQLARTMKRPPKAAEVVEGRPMFEELGGLPEEPPLAESSRFTFRDAPEVAEGAPPSIAEPARIGFAGEAEPFVRPGEPAPHTIQDAISLARLMTEENAPAVMRMVRGGVPLRAIVERVARSRDPQSTTMAPTEVARRALDPAEMPSFEPTQALPEGYTRADAGLPRREFAAPGEGGLRAIEAPEVLPEVAQARAAMEARRVPSPEEPVVRPGYEMVEGSEVLRQTEPVELEPGVHLMPAERRIPDFQPEPLQVDVRGRADYSPPKLEAGFKPPRESRGLVFEQKKYILNEDGTLSPARTRTKEGRLVDEPPDVVARDPEVVGVTPEQMRIVENAAEFFGEDSPIAGIRGDIGLRQMLYEELQLSMYDNIANLMQSKAYREYAATRIANAIREQTGRRKPVSRDAILKVLEEAHETGKVNDVAIGFIDANGSPKRVSVVDAMTRALKSDPELAAATSEALVQANFKRLGTRARKFMHQENIADALLEWHPEYRGNPGALMDALKNPPDIPTELNALIDRYTHWGELPPVIRNTAKQLLDEARVQGRLHHEGATIGLEGLKSGVARLGGEGVPATTPKGTMVPRALQRRLERMQEADPHMLELLGMYEPPGGTAPRSVRIPKLPLDEAMVGREVPQLSIYRPLHNTLKYIAYDKGWMEQNPFPNPFGSLEGLFKGIQKWTKVAHVAANPTAHRNAWLANSLALSLKHGDPTAVLKAIDWGLDFKRWQSGMPTRYPAELHEAMLGNDLLNSGFVAAEIPKTELGLAGQALTKPTDAVIKLFDIPDTVFKGYDTVNSMGRYLKEWESLPAGERMTLPISRQRSLEVTKRAPSEAGLSDMVLRGKQLTRSQMMGVIARSAAEPAARTFVNFNNMPLIQVAKRNIPLWDALFGTPYSGWLSATTTIPGRQGIVGEVLSGAVSRGGTTSRRLMMKRNAEAAAHGFLIYATMGAEAAQRDPNSAVYRQAAAFSPDDVTPTIAYPTDTPGKHQLWRLGSADPLEDIHTTLRMLETARSAFDAGLGYIDPTEVSLMTDEERAKLSKLPPEEVRNLSPSERALYDAAKGLEKASSVGGMNIKHMADLAYVGGSTIADAYTNFIDMRGIPGEGIAPGLAFVKKLALRTIIPGFAGKAYTALNEHEIPRLEDRLARAAGIEDAEEKREVIAELTQDLAIARYLAGSRGRRKNDAWDFDAMSPDPSVHERAARDFTDTVMNHMFNSPRVELMVGKNRRERGSKTERMYREMKTRAVAAVNDRARESIKELQALLDAAKAEREEAQHEVRQAELDKQIEDMRVSIRETKSRFDRITKMVEDEFRIRTDALMQDSLRDSTLRSGFKRGAKVLEEHSAGKRGLRKSLERRPQRQEAR